MQRVPTYKLSQAFMNSNNDSLLERCHSEEVFDIVYIIVEQLSSLVSELKLIKNKSFSVYIYNRLPIQNTYFNLE